MTNDGNIEYPLMNVSIRNRFVVDRRWTSRPLAAKAVSNPFGGVNSIRKMGYGD